MSPIIDIPVSPSEMAFVRGYAKSAEIGGRSNVRASSDRSASMSTDQTVGMIGAYAFHKYLFGHSHLFRVGRSLADAYPLVGDGGSDVPGANIDVKTSMIRTSKPVLEHWLLVRPHEFHAATVYVLALVPDTFASVSLVGWASAASFPPEPLADGPFAGAFGIRADCLTPLPPIRWFAPKL